MRVLLDLVWRSPKENLALEEAILRAVGEGGEPPTLRLWRNPRCVVIGRGQRPEEEVDLSACERLRIPVLKRPSGGGAVYHHPGNLNFSLFLPLTGPWSSVKGSQARLAGLLAAELRRRFSLPAVPRDGGVYVWGKKVSGSAQLRRRALLHHGTLLLWRDPIPMEELLLALRPGYRPTQVASQPAPVGDLSALVRERVPLEEGIRAILSAFRPLGELAQEELSLREWALAQAALD
ncbi:lipoate--protein ligase family protein [Candidatus Bipolaricaulota bacterium]|nr:lipoate--protein ligase family protein [Candidatus Bipolaricaulota bacterium]